VTWSATGGTVNATGLYTAGTNGGTYRVIARGASGHADTSTVSLTAAPPPVTVARLNVTPASATLATGAPQQFVATEQLSDGSSRAAAGATWSATGGTVNATGLYTAGSSAGTFRVIARGTTGHADTASLTITAPPPPPPPPSGSCSAPNLLSHGFDNQSFSPLSGTEGAYITADATARGGYAVRKDWTGGSHDGSTIWANFASTRTVYARWRFKYDSRFNTDGIFKMIRFHAPNLGTMNGTLLIQWGRFVWAWDTFSSAFYQNVGSEITPASLKGDWHWFEVMNDISANGTPRVRMWIDGQLKMDAAGSSTAATNNLSFGTIQWTGTYNSPAATATSWLDDVAVSTNCIGVPDGGTTPPPAPSVSAVIVSPATASVAAGATQQFSATERLSDGSTRPATGVMWAATGGLISGSGVFTAGAVAGSYRVIGVGAGGLADTAAVTVTTSTTPPPTSGAPTNECASPRSGWIWCDDFEQNRLSSYFEVDDGGGGFARTTGVGRNGSVGMRARWAAGQVEAGNLKLAFGRTPNAYFRAVDAGTANYRNVYWRAYVRTQAGWTGGAGWKFTRAIVFANANWAEAAIGSVSGFWENAFLTATGQSGTDAAGNLVTTRYNDFDNLRTVASADGSTRLFDGANANTWHCVEGHMQLNDAGQSNGVLEFWVNGTLQARQANVNWLGAFTAYGINALFFENYWNGGPPQAQERYWDNLVVSTQPIGC
jgi:YD repeat-containing protein